jgi:hypothetical protein
LVFLSSCEPLHSTVTHNTPVFRKGNEFEVNLNTGATGVNMNLAYSPVKHLSLLGSGYSYIPVRGDYALANSSYLEGEMGFYAPYKNFMVSFNAGYGQGACDWHYNGINGVSGYTLDQTKYDSWKLFGHFYMAFYRDSTLHHGFSAKLNVYHDYYYYGKAEAGDLKINGNYLYNGLEALYFLRKRVNKNLYTNIQFGMSIVPYRDVGSAALICRIGFILKV